MSDLPIKKYLVEETREVCVTAKNPLRASVIAGRIFEMLDEEEIRRLTSEKGTKYLVEETREISVLAADPFSAVHIAVQVFSGRYPLISSDNWHTPPRSTEVDVREAPLSEIFEREIRIVKLNAREEI